MVLALAIAPKRRINEKKANYLAVKSPRNRRLLYRDTAIRSAVSRVVGVPILATSIQSLVVQFVERRLIFDSLHQVRVGQEVAAERDQWDFDFLPKLRPDLRPSHHSRSTGRRNFLKGSPIFSLGQERQTSHLRQQYGCS